MKKPEIVIIGAGFGGLATAQALKRAPVNVTLVDRTNHHLFQPLLYQVAIAGLSPADIAVPVRGVLRKQRNATVLLGLLNGVAVSVVHTELGDIIRVISFRQATQHEAEFLFQNIASELPASAPKEPQKSDKAHGRAPRARHEARGSRNRKKGAKARPA